MAIKTVICTECKAEQAIFRKEDGTAQCAFCGAPLENLPEYDESESPDFDCEIKPVAQGVGYEAKFILSRDEVGSALFAAGKIKQRKIIPIVETAIIALIALFMGIFCVCGIIGRWPEMFKRPEGSDWFFFAVFLLLIPFVWYMPIRTKKRIIDASTTGSEVCVIVYENFIDISITGDNGDSWQLMYDDDYGYVHSNGLMVLSLNKGQLLVLPERAFKQEDLQTIIERVSNGHEKSNEVKEAKKGKNA